MSARLQGCERVTRACMIRDEGNPLTELTVISVSFVDGKTVEGVPFSKQTIDRALEEGAGEVSFDTGINPVDAETLT